MNEKLKAEKCLYINRNGFCSVRYKVTTVLHWYEVSKCVITVYMVAIC